MALFTNLHHVGEVMVQLVTDGLSFLDDSAPIQVGAPIEIATGQSDEIRITLLWVTQQPTHRNDTCQINALGGCKAPPITVSAYYLVTTYGSNEGEDPLRAHELLGRVLQVFHTSAQVDLPLSSLPDVGNGRLTFAQVPITPEFVEHVFVPLQVRHRPWVVYEVGPVQLDMLVLDTPPGAQVRPGGLHFGGAEVAARPQLLRLTPQSQGEGGIVRLDVDLKGRALTQVRVGTASVAATALTPVIPNQCYLLTLPSSVKQGNPINLRLQIGDSVTDPPAAFSDAVGLAALSADAATVNAPAPVTLVGSVTLVGRGLLNANEVMIWPDSGSPEASQIISISPGTVTATSVQMSAVALVDAGIVPGVYRLAVRISTGSITPYVLFEVIP